MVSTSGGSGGAFGERRQRIGDCSAKHEEHKRRSNAELGEGEIKMLKKLIFAAGASYLWRKFSGSRRMEPGFSRSGSGSGFGGSRWGRRGSGW